MAFLGGFCQIWSRNLLYKVFLFKPTFLRFHVIFLKLIITMILYENFELIRRKNIM